MATSTAMVPQTNQQDWWDTIQSQAQRLVDGGLFRGKIQSVDQMITIALAARDLDLGLVDAAKNIHVIQGTICMSAEIMLAQVRRTGRYGFRYDRSDRQGATFTIWLREHPDESFTSSFTMEDAKAAGLASNPTWSKYPEIMLRWRAVGNAVRAFAPEVLRKAYTPEEMGAEVEFDAGGEMVVTAVPHEPDNILPVLEGQYEEAEYALPDEWRRKLVDYMVKLDMPVEEQAETLEAIDSEDKAKDTGAELLLAIRKAEVAALMQSMGDPAEVIAETQAAMKNLKTSAEVLEKVQATAKAFTGGDSGE